MISDQEVITLTGGVIGGGGGGGYYGGGGSFYPYVTTTTTGINVNPGIVTPFTPASNLQEFLLSGVPGVGGANKLTPVQLNQLMREHTFVEMQDSDFCLFCYALDQFKTRLDHIFVIREE